MNDVDVDTMVGILASTPDFNSSDHNRNYNPPLRVFNESYTPVFNVSSSFIPSFTAGPVKDCTLNGDKSSDFRNCDLSSAETVNQENVSSQPVRAGSPMQCTDRVEHPGLSPAAHATTLAGAVSVEAKEDLSVCNSSLRTWSFCMRNDRLFFRRKLLLLLWIRLLMMMLAPPPRVLMSLTIS